MQSAMNALNPVLTIGAQMRDACKAHSNMTKRRSRRARRRCCGSSASTRSTCTATRTSCRGGMRQRAMIAMALLFTPRARDHGRADVGAGRRRPALAHGADQGAAGAPRLRGRLRHARHVARPPLLRPAARHVRRAGGRARARPGRSSSVRATHTRSGLLEAFPSIHGAKVALMGIPGSPPDLARPPSGCRFSPRCPHATAACRRAPSRAGGASRAIWCAACCYENGARRGSRGHVQADDRAAAPHRQPDPPFRGRQAVLRRRCTRSTTSTSPSAEGEIVALVGESGSGKSTIARLLARVYKPTEGEIYFEGEPLSRAARPPPTARLRGDVPMVFQDPYSSINPAYRVSHGILRGIKLHRHDLARGRHASEVERVLGEVGLVPAARVVQKFPHELSGGQRQRVGFAQALASGRSSSSRTSPSRCSTSRSASACST